MSIRVLVRAAVATAAVAVVLLLLVLTVEQPAAILDAATPLAQPAPTATSRPAETSPIRPDNPARHAETRTTGVAVELAVTDDALELAWAATGQAPGEILERLEREADRWRGVEAARGLPSWELVCDLVLTPMLGTWNLTEPGDETAPAGGLPAFDCAGPHGPWRTVTERSVVDRSAAAWRATR